MIDEKRLIKELEKLKQEINMPVDVVWNNLLKFCIDTVNEQSKVGEWIPCSERLPDTGTEVLVTLGYTYESDYTMYSIARYVKFEDDESHWCDNRYGYLEWDKYSDGRGGNSSYKVIAWMPLPEAYKGQ